MHEPPFIFWRHSGDRSVSRGSQTLRAAFGTPSLSSCVHRSPFMGNKLYVGNLPYSVRDGDLEQAFGQFGAVTSAKVMMERDTGRSKGFGFVEMGSDAEAQAAINGMNGQPLGGRSVVVNEARPMEARPPRSGGG